MIERRVRMPAMVRLSAWLLGCVISGMACAQPSAAELVIARIKPSIVAVGTYQASRTPPFQFRGTGFAVADGRTIVTNAHVLSAKINREKLEKLVIALPSSNGNIEIKTARASTADPSHDLALLRIDEALPALTVGDAKDVREGHALLFTGFPIGNALGLYPATHRAMISAITPIAIPLPNGNHLSADVVRRLSREPFSVFQLDATAYPGNSGSPLYDPETGEVQGVINMVFVKGSKEAALSHPSGITYAIPAIHLHDLLQREASQ
ncbi:MAG TPA: serine protease [Burkholderiales bacterium]